MDTPLNPSQCHKEEIRTYATSLGFDACGFTSATQVSHEDYMQYRKWIAAGKHDTMQYLEKYDEVRRDPRLLLEGAETIIAVALNYYPSTFQPREAPQFAYYAYGRDYHEVVKEKLHQLASRISERFNATSRACVDTAPLRERYWAKEAGIGFIGLNNQLILPGKGSYFFLGFLITTLRLPPDEPCTLSCGNCRRCVALCPAHALNDNGACDARLCLSSLTIEHRGELPEKLTFGNRIYGCDVCQKACMHNRNAKATQEEAFIPSEALLTLSRESISKMTEEDFRNTFRHSAIKRIKLAQLLRNLQHLDD